VAKSEDMEGVGFSNSSAVAFSAVKDVVGGEAWITAVVGAVITFSTSLSLWMYGVRQRGQKSGPVNWPVIGSIMEMRRNFPRLNDWYLDYFSENVKTWRLKVPFPLSQNIIATVDPVNVEYILTNIQKYGKVRFQ